MAAAMARQRIPCLQPAPLGLAPVLGPHTDARESHQGKDRRISIFGNKERKKERDDDLPSRGYHECCMKVFLWLEMAMPGPRPPSHILLVSQLPTVLSLRARAPLPRE